MVFLWFTRDYWVYQPFYHRENHFFTSPGMPFVAAATSTRCPDCTELAPEPGTYHSDFCPIFMVKRWGWHGDVWWEMGLSENVVHPIVPNGFADHYPVFKWLFHWEYTLFSDKPKWFQTPRDETGVSNLAKYRCKKSHLPPLWLSFLYNGLEKLGEMGNDLRNICDTTVWLIPCMKECKGWKIPLSSMVAYLQPVRHSN